MRHLHRLRPATLLAAVSLLAVAVAAIPARAQTGAADATPATAQESTPGAFEPYRDLSRRADALVTVKYLLEVNMPGAAEQEKESEISCLLISRDGFILCSNAALGGYMAMVSRLMGGGVSLLPKQIEVLIGDATEGPSARVVARDSDRDLAWLTLDEPPAEADGLEILDFSDAAELEPGDVYYRLRRMDEFFGRVPVVEEGRVSAKVAKPRPLLVPEKPGAGTPGDFGQPVFAADGRPVGITVLQLPSADDAGFDLAGAALGNLGNQLQDMAGGLILPAADIVRATQLARESLEAQDEE